MRLIHVVGDDNTDQEGVVFTDDAECAPEDWCPAGWRVSSITEIGGDELPGSLPTECLLRRDNA